MYYNTILTNLYNIDLTPLKEMKPAPNAGLKQGDMNITLEHHLIEHDLFVGRKTNVCDNFN